MLAENAIVARSIRTKLSCLFVCFFVCLFVWGYTLHSFALIHMATVIYLNTLTLTRLLIDGIP